MTYILGPGAASDLDRIYRNGAAQFGFAQADAYVSELKRVLELLGTNPRMARLRKEIEPPVRIHPHRSHLIVYDIEGDTVLILRIRHANENWSDEPA